MDNLVDNFVSNNLHYTRNKRYKLHIKYQRKLEFYPAGNQLALGEFIRGPAFLDTTRMFYPRGRMSVNEPDYRQECMVACEVAHSPVIEVWTCTSGRGPSYLLALSSKNTPRVKSLDHTKWWETSLILT